MTDPTSQAPTAQVGRVVAGRYRLLTLLGSGGMGQVYHAQHVATGGSVAVKLLHASFIRDVDAASRFRQEARNAAALDHPNTIRVIDYGIDDRTPFLTLEYLAGHSLEQVLETEGRLPWPRAAAILTQVLRGLWAAHSHELAIVHSDIKPSNILLVEAAGVSDFVKVLDFGISYALEGSGTFSHGMLGSPHTMAPEQWHAERQTPATDLYAVGCVAFEMLAGEPVFDAPVPMAIALKHCGDAPRVAERLGDDVPAPLAAWIETLLRKAATDRPANAEAALNALSEALEASNPRPDATPSDAMTARTWDETGARSPEVTQHVAVPHNLPIETSTFVGRQDALERLALPVDGGARLTTLLGPGGMGKSRLAARFAVLHLGTWPGGVRWCDLASAVDGHDVLEAVARAFDVQLGDEDPATRVADILASLDRALVILDNAEQIYAATAGWVSHWLERAPGVTFLVTSRHPLGVEAEVVLDLDPLPTPDADDTDPNSIAARPAVELFVQRAVIARGHYTLTAAEAPLVAAIVRRLDGLPLAIELAAARCRTSPTDRILAGLDHRFSLLRSRAPGRPDRHAALEATIAWSWELLDEVERTALSQCAVFRAGFTLEAAESVFDLPFVDGAPPFVPDVIDALVDHSLLRVRTDGDTPRFEALASIAAFAADRLRERLDEDATRLRHAHTYAELAGRAIADLGVALVTPEELDPIANDIENLELAARTAITHGLGRAGARILAAICTYALIRGPVGPARGLLELAIDTLQLEAEDQIALELHRGRLAMAAGDSEATRHHVDCALGAALRQRHERLAGWTLELLARIEHQDRRYDEALNHLRTARGCAVSTGDRSLEATVDYLQGSVCHSLGQSAERLSHWQRAATLAREAGDTTLEAIVRHSLAYEELYTGAVARAREHAEAVIEVGERTRDWDSLSWFLHTAAVIDDLDGLLEPSLARHRRAVELAVRVGRTYNQARFRHGLGGTLAHAGHLGLAMDELHRALDLARQADADSLAALILATLGEVHGKRGELTLALERGREAVRHAANQPSDRRGRATTLIPLARNLAAAGALAEATTTIAEARATFADTGPPSMTARALIVEARVCHLNGDPAAAIARLDTAEALIRGLGVSDQSSLWLDWREVRAL